MIVEDGGSGVIQKSFSQLIFCPRSLSCIPLSRFKVDSFQRKEMRTRMDWKWCQMRKMMFATQGIQSMSIPMTYHPRIHSTMLTSVQSHRDSYNSICPFMKSKTSLSPISPPPLYNAIIIIWWHIIRVLFLVYNQCSFSSRFVIYWTTITATALVTKYRNTSLIGKSFSSWNAHFWVVTF